MGFVAQIHVGESLSDSSVIAEDHEQLGGYGTQADDELVVLQRRSDVELIVVDPV
ncbi:MAG: hypothetical protein ACJAQW_000436 [Paracoccaceae bacterium]